MRVPEYDSQQVQPQGIPDVRAQPMVDPAGQAVGQGLEQLGQGVERAAKDVFEVQRAAQGKADGIAHGNLDTNFEHGATTITLGNQGGTADVNTGTAAAPAASADGSGLAAPWNPAADKDLAHAAPTGPPQAALDKLSDPAAGLSPKGFFNEEGQAAAKYAHPTLEALAQLRQQIAAAAPNDRVREMFLESSGKRLEEYRIQIERHTSQQLRVAGEQALQARGAVGLSAIGRDISAPGVKDSDILYSLDSNTDEVARTIQAVHPGELGAEQAAAYKQQATSLVMKHYIDAKDFRGAQNLFDQRREDLGDQADAFAKTIKNLGDQQGAVQVAGGIVDSAKRPDGTYDMAAIDRQALALPPEKRTDLVMKELESRRALASQNNGGLASNYFNDALADYQNNGFNLNAIKPATATWLQQSDPKGWKAILDEDERRQAAKRRGADHESPDQLSTFYELKDTYRGLSPDELAKLDPKVVVHDALAAGVSLKRAGELADQVVQLRAHAPASDSALTKSQNDEVMAALEDSGHAEMRHGVLRVKKGDEQLRGKIEQEILKHQASMRGALPQKEKGYTLDGDDLQKFVGPMLTPVVTEKNLIFPDKTAPAVAAPGYESQAIPSRDADQIRSALQGAGRDATPAAIQEVWRTHHGGAPAPAARGPSTSTTKVEDLAKDPQALSALHPAAQQAVARLAPKTIVLPELQLSGKPTGPKPIVLPEMKVTGKPPAKKPETLADTVKGMGVDKASLDAALEGAH